MNCKAESCDRSQIQTNPAKRENVSHNAKNASSFYIEPNISNIKSNTKMKYNIKVGEN